MPFQIVIDTSVFVAALRSSRGAAFRLLSLVGRSQAFEVNVSIPLVLEYEDVTSRESMVPGLSSDDLNAIIDYICSVANHHDIFYLWRPYLIDPMDDMVLELAVKARCDFIVTFNGRHFSGADRFGVQAVKPQEFLRIIGELK